MPLQKFHPLTCTLLLIAVLLALGGCAPSPGQKKLRYFWPPPPAEAKIEYLNYYFSDADLQRGVDHRLENAILGKSKALRIVNQPYSVASDGQGRIIVGDFSGYAVNILDRANRSSRQLLAMKGPPFKVLVDGQGEIWALDGANAIVYRWSAAEKPFPELKLIGMARASSLTVDSQRQRLYLSDTPNHRICVYDYAGLLLQSFGKRGSGPGQFNYPTDLDLDDAGNLYVVDSMNARIEVLSPEGLFLRAFGERGTERGSFFAPKGIAVSPAGLVYVTDANQNKVVIFTTSGEYLLTLGGRYLYDGSSVRPGGLYFPVGIDVDAKGTIFVADFFNGMIHEFQYLTPEFLAQQPIRREEVYNPRAVDQREDLAPPLLAPPEPSPALQP